jgi:hypothetical protein
MTNDRIPHPTGNEGTVAQLVSNYLIGCVLTASAGN